MQDIFMKILSMGINASWIILAVMLFRVLFKKAPKWIICFLWIAAGFKLICPFSIESPVSLVPARQEILSFNPGSTSIKNGNGIIYIKTENKPSSTGSTKPANENYNQPETRIINIFTILWVAGIIIMLSYLLGSHIHICKKVSTATHLRKNIWESEFVNSPFILGLLKPRIYIPYNINNKQLAYILAHENAHLARKDHILKTLAFVILSVYWFHPLVWVYYILLCRDIEFACDEKAVLLMDTQEKKEYMFTLLSCSSGKNNISVSPLSFGETRIKERVLHVKNFKKQSFILTAIVFLTGIIISICFLANPKEQKTALSSFYTLKEKPSSGMEIFTPYLSLDTENKTFCFVYDLLLSYMPTGSYTEKDNKILLSTDDGKFHYTFKKDSKNTLSFIANSSSPVKLTDSRMGIEIKNGSVFEPSSTKQPDGPVILETKQASVDLNQSTGADGVMLYYADAGKIIFGGYFGLFVHDKASGKIIQSLDLEYIGCNHTQGDDYCSIAASNDGTNVYMKPLRQNKLYTFNTLSGTLEIRDCQKEYSIWEDSSLDLFHTEDIKQASYQDGKEKKTCQLHEGNWTIGDCTYSEYNSNKTVNKKETVYHPLFQPE